MRDSESEIQLIEKLRSIRQRMAGQDKYLADSSPVFTAMDDLYGGVFQDLRLVLYRVDHHTGKVEYVTRSVTTVMGMTVEEAKTTPEEGFFARIHPEDVEGVREIRNQYRRQVRNDPSALGMYEARWRKSPDEWIWLRCRFMFVLDAEGKVFVETGTLDDITDRKKKDRQLHEIQHEHEVILDSISEHVVYHDLDMNVIWLNRAAAESLNIAPDEAVGKKCYDLWQERGAPCDGCPVVKALRTQQPSEFEMTTPEGRIWHVRGYPSFNADGELIGVTEVTRDITEIHQAEELLRKAHSELELRVQERTADLRQANANLKREVEERAKAQEALRQQESLFRALAETVPTAVFIVQGNKYKYINPFMVQASGYTREELLNGTYLEHLHPEYRELAWRRAAARLRGENVPSRYELKYIHKDGSTRWMDASMSVLEYEGAPAILVSAIDTTERKEDEERLRDAHMQLLNAREEERRHLAGELHDSLAQDLVVLQLVLQCGTSAMAKSAIPQEWLTEATAMCTKMIGDIRRMSHGLYPPMLETLGLRKALQSLADQYEVAGRKVEIQWQCAADRRYSRPVEITLFRIVQEAMSNAVRHGLADHAVIRVHCTGYSVILEVIDNGRGFEDKKPEQMGLGMRSMQDRLSMVDGKLTVTSHPGRTCIRVEIPGILPEDNSTSV